MPRAPVPCSEAPRMITWSIPSSRPTSESVAPETSETLRRVSFPSSKSPYVLNRESATTDPRIESPKNSRRS